MAPQSQFKYHIVNAQSGTVLDLSGTNQTTSTSFVAHEIPIMLEYSLLLGKQRRRQPAGAFRTLPQTTQAMQIVLQWYIEHVDPAIGLITIKNVRYGKFVSFTGAMPPMHSEVPAVGAKESRLPWKIEELGQGLCR